MLQPAASWGSPPRGRPTDRSAVRSRSGAHRGSVPTTSSLSRTGPCPRFPRVALTRRLSRLARVLPTTPPKVCGCRARTSTARATPASSTASTIRSGLRCGRSAVHAVTLPGERRRARRHTVALGRMSVRPGSPPPPERSSTALGVPPRASRCRVAASRDDHAPREVLAGTSGSPFAAGSLAGGSRCARSGGRAEAHPPGSPLPTCKQAAHGVSNTAEHGTEAPDEHPPHTGPAEAGPTNTAGRGDRGHPAAVWPRPHTHRRSGADSPVRPVTLRSRRIPTSPHIATSPVNRPDPRPGCRGAPHAGPCREW